MKIFVNVDSRQLQSAVGDSRQVSSLSFKRGDGASVEIIFVRDGAQVELTTGSIVTFGAKLSGKYDANALVLENGFALTGSGTTASYVGAPSFNTVDLDAALEKDGDDTNDVSYLDLMGEISWTDGPTGEPTSTDTFTVRVNNDVLRGDEVGPVDITGGTPVNFVANFYETSNGGGGNKDIRFVQVDDGAAPTVVLSPASFSTPISVAVSGRTITVTCAAAIGSITNTAAQVISAINGSGAASAILTASNKSGSDGSEVMSVSGGPWVLAGGVTGTPGRLGSMEVDSSYLYVVASVTDGVPLWKKIALSAL